MIPLKLIIRNLLVTMSFMIVIGGYLECVSKVVVLDSVKLSEKPIGSKKLKDQKKESIFNREKINYLYYLSPSINIQNELFFELGISYGAKYGDDTKTGHLFTQCALYSFKLSSEFYKTSSYVPVIFGPKISFETNMFVITSLISDKPLLPVLQLAIGCRLGVVNYTNFEQNMVCFIPEIGLETPLYNYLSIFYGYNYLVGGTRFREISNSRLSITLNIPF